MMRRVIPSSRILLVLDDRDFGRQTQSMLVALGYSVPALTRPGGEALEHVEEYCPDLVLIDAQARGALKTASWVHERFGLPVVFLADQGTDLSLERAPFLCGHITKPLAAQTLKPALDAAFGAGNPNEAGLNAQILRQTLANLGQAVMVADLAGNVVYLNAQAERLTGWSLEKAAGRPCDQVFPTNGSQLKTRDGSEIQLEVETATLENEDGGMNGVVTIFRDVSREKAAESEQNRAQKLEGLGFLARGFAHDFNNLLTVLFGNLSVARARVRGDEELAYELEQAASAALKAENLVQQLLTFARGGTPIRCPVDARRLLARVLAEFNGQDVAFELDPGFPQAIIHADPKQVRRLVENLLQNAEQAMGGGCVRVRGQVDDAFLTLRIADTGPGMPPEVREQAFEPFFTTRAEANASGLGLTVCESIARAHGGSISLSSNPNQGTTATVRLPLATDEQKRKMSTPTNPQSAATNGSRVLVLEDEEGVSRLIATTLGQAGYQVTEAREGQQAVDAFEQAATSGTPFSLLIADLTIESGMGGLEAMSRIRKIDPNVRGIVSSGYSDEPAMANPGEFGFAGVLPKPYEPKELVDVVGQVLAS